VALARSMPFGEKVFDVIETEARRPGDGRNRVARLMSHASLAGVNRRKFVTTAVKGDSRQAPDPRLRVSHSPRAGSPPAISRKWSGKICS
jgi:hypothetical protein